MGFFMDTHDDVKRLADPVAVLCIWNGCIFCNSKQELETIDRRTCGKNFASLHFWSVRACTCWRHAVEVLLQLAFGLYTQSRSFVVFGEHLCLCCVAIANLLLF